MDDIAKRVNNLSPAKRTLLELKLRKKATPKSLGGESAPRDLAKRVATLSLAKRTLLELRLRKKAAAKSSGSKPVTNDLAKRIANLPPAKRALLELKLKKKAATEDEPATHDIMEQIAHLSPAKRALLEFRLTKKKAGTSSPTVSPSPAMPPPTEAPEEVVTTESTDDTPDWLGELPDVGEDTSTAEIEAAAEGEIKMPDWLGELPDVGEDTPTAEMEAAAEGEIEMPDWLGEEIPAEEIEETPTVGETSDGLTDILSEEPQTPSWLGEDEISNDQVVAEPFEAEEEPPTPDWLTEMGEAIRAADVAPPTDSGILDFDEEPELPAWLSDIENPDAIFGEVQIDQPAASSPAVEASPSPPAPPSPPPAPAAGKSSWVDSLRPTTEEAVTDDRDNKTAEATGMLSGISALLPAEKIAIPTHETGSLQEAAQEFYKIATEAPQPATLPTLPTSGEKAVGGVIRSLLYLLFIVLIAVPLLLNNSQAPWSEPTGDDGEVLDSQRRQLISEQLGIIDLQQPGSVALVSFDYSTATQGEMQPLVEAIVGRLKGQGMRLIAVSLEPEGAILAQNTLERVLAEREQEDEYGVEVINLGYLPGQMAAIRALVTGQDSLSTIPDYKENVALNTRPEWDGIQSLEQVNIIVTFADNPTTARWWVEQLAAAPQPAGGERFLLAATSAVAEPFLRPYRDSEQLNGLIAGVNGAAAIEAGRNRFDSARQMIDSVGIATIFIVFLIVLGIIAGWMPSQIPDSSAPESNIEPVESAANNQNESST